VSKGFPYKGQIEELFGHGLLSVFQTTFLLQHTFQRHDIGYLCWKCP